MTEMTETIIYTADDDLVKAEVQIGNGMLGFLRLRLLSFFR